MLQKLTFDRYYPAKDGYPDSHDYYQPDCPLEIDERQRTRLATEAGFNPTQKWKIGILRRDWVSKSGRRHPSDALIVVPHWDFGAFTQDEHFAVSRERIQRAN